MAKHAALARRWSAALVASLAWALGADAQAVPAQQPIEDVWVTDGAVFAARDTGDTLYFGGNFRVVAPPTGSFAMLDATGAVRPGLPKVDGGSVLAAIGDGTGGWILGGDFTRVGGLPRAGLARVLADGRVAQWNPGADGPVRALLRKGATVYVGGTFGTLAGAARNFLGAVDLTSGATLASWVPDPNGTVRALAADPAATVIYAGGDFTVAGGQPRQFAAAVNAADQPGPGLATTWNPSVACAFSLTACFATGAVRVDTLLVTATDVYLGGLFDQVNGTPRRENLAVVDRAAGSVRTWHPDPSDEVLGLALDGGTLYAGGLFTKVNASTVIRPYLAAFDANPLGAGADLGWAPAPDRDVAALASAPGKLYVGGSFERIAATATYRAARFDLASFPPTLDASWLPRPTAAPTVFASAGPDVVVGGSFAGIGGAERLAAAALDLTANPATLKSWNPLVTGGSATVLAIETRPGNVYLGGDFDFLGSPATARRALAEVNDTGGTVVGTFVPPALGPGDVVRALGRDGGGWLYVGGSLAGVGGCPNCRNVIRSNEIGGGNDAAWADTVDTDGAVQALVATPAAVYVGGDFGLVNAIAPGASVARSRAAALHPAGGVLALDPDVRMGLASPSVRDLELVGGNLDLAGQFATLTAAADPRSNAGAVALSPAPPPTSSTGWRPNPTGATYALAAGPAGSGWVFLGGDFLGLASTPVSRLGLVRDTDGVPVPSPASPWDPRADATVYALTGGTSRTTAGGAFATIGGRLRSGLAAFCENQPVPSGLTATGTAGNTIHLAWNAIANAHYRVYRGFSPNGPWTPLTTLVVPTTAAAAFDDTTAESGTSYSYHVRVEEGLPQPCLSDPSNVATATTGGVCGLPPFFDGLSLAEWRDGAVGTPCTAHVEWPAAAPACGAATVSYAVYRSTNPGFVPDASNRVAVNLTSTAYDDAEDLAGGTSYTYVVRATNPWNGEEDQNLIRGTVPVPVGCGGHATAPARVPLATVRSQTTTTPAASSNVVTWQLPASGGLPADYCLRLCAGGGLTTPCASPGLFEACGDPPLARQTFTDTPLSPGAPRDYTLFRIFHAALPDQSSSAGPSAAGRPDDAAPDEAWAYSTGASALVVPAIYPGAAYATISNDRRVHAMTPGATGGLWPAAWAPPAMNAPAASGPAFLPATGALAGKKVLIVGGTDGRVYAFDADTGGQLWVRSLATPAVVARPTAMFSEAGGVGNWVFVGTRDSVGPNRMYMLNLSDGSPTAYTFPTSAQGTGVIHAPILVDYPGQRVFIASRRLAGGNGDSLFCMSLAAATRGLPCTGWPADDGGVNVGADIDVALSLRNGRLFFATVTGDLASVDAGTGTDLDSVALGAAAKGIWTYDAGGGETRILVSTGSALVHYRRPSSGPFGGVSGWSPASGAPYGGFSAPLLASNGKIYVGTGNGQVRAYQLADGSPAGAVTLGDGTATIGSPTRDVNANLLLVGASSGVIYAVPVF